jgi:hypothetical protein
MNWNPEKRRNMLQQVRRWNSRLALLHKKTRLNCVEHGLQAVIDFRPLAKQAVLACGCHRSVELDLPDADRRELVAFLASPEGQSRRRVAGSQNSTKHFEVTYEEDLPREIAA